MLTRGLLLAFICSAGSAVGAASANAATASPLYGWGLNDWGEATGQAGPNQLTPAPVVGVPEMISASTGNNFGVGIDARGQLWTWGNDQSGQAANGQYTGTEVAPAAVGATGFVQVAAGHGSGYAVASDGSLWDWGDDSYNELGQMTTLDNNCICEDSPVQVGGLSNLVAVSGGSDWALELDAAGQLYAQGKNDSGATGVGGTDFTVDTPTKLGTVTGFEDGQTGDQAVSAAAGNAFGLAATANGTVFAWGTNQNGELGRGTTGGYTGVPQQVPGLSNVIEVAAGTSTAYALTSSGVVYAWGRNADGETGVGGTADVLSPQQVSGLSGVTSIGSSSYDGYAVDGNGKLYAWGSGGYYGALGDGNLSSALTPVFVEQAGIGTQLSSNSQSSAYLVTQPSEASRSVSRLSFAAETIGSASSSQSVTLTNSGGVPLTASAASLGAGDGDEFQIVGDGCRGKTLAAGASCQVSVIFAPTRAGSAAATLELVTSADVSELDVSLSGAGLASGLSGLPASVTPGSVFGTGLNGNGQLGSGGTASVSLLGPLGSGAPSSFVSVSAGGSFSAGLTADGRVFAWGQNTYGQLGNGSTTDAHAPVQVALPSGIVAISAGLDHALAVRSDGTVWAWGYNAHGQLGDGSSVNRSVPVQVPGLSNVIAVAAGAYQSYALLSDGTVRSWGYGLNNALGNGSVTTSTVPVTVTGLTGVTAIAAGAYHGLALESDGTLRAWGYNSQGQVGNGTMTNAPVPVTVSGISTAIGIAAGADHSLAVLQGGSVKAWGYNAKGQIGNGTTTSAKTPVAVAGLPAISQVSAGASHSLALASNGTVWGWGTDANGQLGNGSTAATVSSPVQMTSAGHGGGALGSGSEGNHSLVIGQPYASLSPGAGSTISFTAPGVGQSSTSLTETVTDTGIEPLSFGQASIAGADGDEFVITGDGCSNLTIAVGASCVIGLRFNEKVNETNPVATLRIPSNSPTGPDTVKLDPPQEVGAGTDGAQAPGTASATVPGVPAANSPAAGTTTSVAAPAAGAGHLSCRQLIRQRTLRVTCHGVQAGRHLTLKLIHNATVVAHREALAGGRTLRLRWRLPARLRQGAYQLEVTAAGSSVPDVLSLRLSRRD